MEMFVVTFLLLGFNNVCYVCRAVPRRAVQVEMTAASLYVNLTVIKSMSAHITAAGFIRRLCSTPQTDAQGQPRLDEALTPTLPHPTRGRGGMMGEAFVFTQKKKVLSVCLNLCCHHIHNLKKNTIKQSSGVFRRHHGYLTAEKTPTLLQPNSPPTLLLLSI